MKLALTLLVTLHGAVALAQVDPIPPARCDLDANGRSKLMAFYPHVNDGHNQQHIDWGVGNGGLATQGSAVPYNGAETYSWRLAAMNDFDGNGTCDLFWQREGEVIVTLTPLGGHPHAPFPDSPGTTPDEGPGWSLVGSGHLDENAGADLVWWNGEARKLRAWLSTHSEADPIVTDLEGEAPPAPWEASAVVALGGNGAEGILWRHAGTGALLYSWLDGLALGQTSPVPLVYGSLVGPHWRLAAVGDFNGGGHEDLIWQEPIQEMLVNTGRVVVWFMRGRTAVQENLLDPAVLDLPGSADPGLVRGPR